AVTVMEESVLIWLAGAAAVAGAAVGALAVGAAAVAGPAGGPRPLRAPGRGAPGGRPPPPRGARGGGGGVVRRGAAAGGRRRGVGRAGAAVGRRLGRRRLDRLRRLVGADGVRRQEARGTGVLRRRVRRRGPGLRGRRAGGAVHVGGVDQLFIPVGPAVLLAVR